MKRKDVPKTQTFDMVKYWMVYRTGMIVNLKDSPTLKQLGDAIKGECLIIKFPEFQVLTNNNWQEIEKKNTNE